MTETIDWISPGHRRILKEIAEVKAEIKHEIAGLRKDVMASVEEVTALVNTLTEDLTTKFGEISTELTKLEGEIENPAALESLKGLVEGADNAVKGFSVPTS